MKALRQRPNTPEGEKDGVEIRHRSYQPGDVVEIVNVRNAFLRGYKPLRATFTDTLLYRQLCYEGGVWMTDHPNELWQMAEVADKVDGRVLVGGLGLGVVSHLMAQRRKVNEVTTVELDQRIIDLVRPHVHLRVQLGLVQSDLFDFINSVQPGQFDSAFLDIWQPTGERCWTEYVVPLRRALRGKIPQSSVHCWAEDEMQGQLYSPLARSLAMPLEVCFAFHYRVFCLAAFKRGLCKEPTQRPTPSEVFEAEIKNSENPEIATYRHFFVCGVGTDEWEAEFSELWDKCLEEDNARHKADNDE
jgi:hypothetical protein